MHRAIIDHWVFEEPEALKLWVYFLSKANHGEKKVMLNGALVRVQRGQFITGRKVLSQTLGISESKIRRFLKTLKKESMISQQTTSKYSLISITNYDAYQSAAQQKANKKPRESQHTTTNNNVNNENNGTISINSNGLDFSKWPELPSIQVWDDYRAHRKNIKASVSQTVINLLSKELNLAFAQGYSVDRCLSEQVEANWQGFKFNWLLNREKGNEANKRNISTSDRQDDQLRQFLSN